MLGFDEIQSQSQFIDEPNDWIVTLLLSFFLGCLWVHRFYTRHTGIGVAQLLALGGYEIWAFINFIINLVGNFKDAKGYPLKRRQKFISGKLSILGNSKIVDVY